MIDKIKAEADAIVCDKEQRIDELEQERDSLALKLGVTAHKLKAALDERDEALAYAERLREFVDRMNGYALRYEDGDEADSMLSEKPTTALAALKAEWQAEVVESFLHGLSSSDTINIHNRRPDARVEWFRKRAQEAGYE